MDIELKESMASGVFVEFCDARGDTMGQAVFTGWQGRPVPAQGDLVCCGVVSPTGRRQKLVGRVVSRHFELQHQHDGEPCVWVRLRLQTEPRPKKPLRPGGGAPSRISFSAN
jgi:hypothetical protein